MTKRAEHTKERIHQALLDLLQEKPYEIISMSEIAQKAACSRVTVHRHYGSKDNLLLDCYEETVEAVKEDLLYSQDLADKSASELAYANIVVFYTHVAENRALYRALFSTVVGNTIRTRFRRFVAGATMRMMQEEGNIDLLPVAPNVVANLTADMVVGAIIWWLESNSNFAPTLLAEIVLRVSETGIFGLTGQRVRESDISFVPFPANWLESGEPELPE